MNGIKSTALETKLFWFLNEKIMSLKLLISLL
jgi:hypothetical protein